MTKLPQIDSSHEEVSGNKDGQTMVIRVPRPNLQIVVLSLIAFITLFQTFQLVRISSKASSAVNTTPTNTQTGSGSNAEVPESMVGGC